MATSVGPRGLYSIQRRAADPLNALARAAGLGVLLALCSLWAATEYAAWQFGFQRALGQPVAGPLYMPWAGLAWAWSFRHAHDPRITAIFTHQWLVLGAGMFLSAVLCVATVVRASRKSAHSDLHGSAHWASENEIKRAGLLGNGQGVYVGAWQDGAGRVRYLRHDGPEHVLAFAPTRSGKGVGLVLPTLLSWPHSVVVHDIKGENYALTAGWRATELGSRALKFDPTAADGSSARFNPLAEVRLRTEYEMKDVQNIVAMLVDPDGTAAGGNEAHWIATGSALLAGVILHVLYLETDKSLGGVAHFLSDPSFTAPEQLYSYMLNSAHDPALELGWSDSLGQPCVTHPIVAMAARDMLNKDPKEATSVLSTAVRFLTLFRDPIVARNIAQSDFRVADLMNDDRPLSLYLVVPPSDIDRVKPLTRLILNQILRTLTAEMAFRDGRSVANYKHRLLLMIDELPSLGRLEILQTALAYIAGYGIKAYLITQDLAQLTAAYGGSSGRDETIVANCHVMVAYAPNKIETMDLLSQLAGKMTVRTETRSYMGARVSAMRSQVTVSEQEQERALLTPDEARRLPPDDALVFVAGHAPIYGKKIKYYQDPTFAARAKIPLPALPASCMPAESAPAHTVSSSLQSPQAIDD